MSDNIVCLKFEADFVLVIEENTTKMQFLVFFPKKLSESLESSNVLIFYKPEKVSTIFEHWVYLSTRLMSMISWRDINYYYYYKIIIKNNIKLL